MVIHMKKLNHIKVFSAASILVLGFITYIMFSNILTPNIENHEGQVVYGEIEMDADYVERENNKEDAKEENSEQEIDINNDTEQQIELIEADKDMEEQIKGKEDEEQLEEIELFFYEGKITNIFFHPLIAFPELAFDGDSMHQQMDNWFVTVTEFNRILDSLYKNNYILIDIRDTYEIRNEEGKEIMVKKELFLPENKKPLILSIDDLNYYTYMKNNGTVHKLILDSEGNIATKTHFPGEEKMISYDNEIIPILESFIAKNPDFSHNGARGVIALTGFNGVLGYDTHKITAPEYQEEKQQAIEAINYLKEMGWTFSSHGYYHYDTARVEFNKLLNDTKRWEKEVSVLTGPTEFYIYPFGATVRPGSDRFKHLIDAGFRAFWGVGPNSQFQINHNYLLMDRINLDGVYFTRNRGKTTQLFDVDSIIDDARGWD